MALALIIARSGSKRVPNKNTRSFLGKPIIEYVIEAAREANFFSEIYLSSEDEEICRIGERAGAYIPFLRPKELSGDSTRAEVVVGHFIKELKLQDSDEDLCLILPTNPGLHPSDLSQSFKVWKKSQDSYKTLFGVVERLGTIYRNFLIDTDNELSPIFPDHLLKQSHELPRTYEDAGCFYWAKPKTWIETKSITSEHAQGWLLPNDRFIDINTEEEWKMAELMLFNHQNN